MTVPTHGGGEVYYRCGWDCQESKAREGGLCWVEGWGQKVFSPLSALTVGTQRLDTAGDRTNFIEP